MRGLLHVDLKYVCRRYLTLIGVYAPEERKRQDIENFYDDLKKELDKVNSKDSLVACGDLNAIIGIICQYWK